MMRAAFDDLPVLEHELALMLAPKDKDENASAILEVRAGTGGDEAALFAGDLFRMYQRYAQSQGWRVEVDSISEGEMGGYKEIIASITGDGVFGRLKFESGVHRVQRVPATEAQGRIHTSACTVAVLPEADEAEEVMRVILHGLWNRLSEHQNARTPFRLPRFEVLPTRQSLLELSRMRAQELKGFVDGLFGTDHEMLLPQKAHEAVVALAELHAMFEGAAGLLADGGRAGAGAPVGEALRAPPSPAVAFTPTGIAGAARGGAGGELADSSGAAQPLRRERQPRGSSPQPRSYESGRLCHHKN